MADADPVGELVRTTIEPRPRYGVRLRSMMIAVALLAVLLGIEVRQWRSARDGYDQAEAHKHRIFEESERKAAEFHRASTNPAASAMFAARADYHAPMAKKYEDAAARDLTTVEPDPPQPP